MNNNPNYRGAGISGGISTKQKWDKIKEDYLKTNPSNCLTCKNILSYKHRKNKFCSRSCSAVFNNTVRIVSNDQKSKTSNTLILYQTEKYLNNPNKCEVCNSPLGYTKRKRKTCSEGCLKKQQSIAGSIGGRKSAQVQAESRRSKNEILFAEKCIEYFDKVLTNEPIFNGWDADIIIEDLKVAILWNGKWHYEKITEKHSVKQVQNRDKIKVDEIEKYGYIPYIIKDMGKFSENKVNKEFNKFLKWACIASVS